MFAEVVRGRLVNAALCRAAAPDAPIFSQQCAGGLINSKQLDDKFPLELVFLFARHVRWLLSLANLCREASNSTARGKRWCSPALCCASYDAINK